MTRGLPNLAHGHRHRLAVGSILHRHLHRAKPVVTGLWRMMQNSPYLQQAAANRKQWNDA